MIWRNVPIILGIVIIIGWMVSIALYGWGWWVHG